MFESAYMYLLPTLYLYINAVKRSILQMEMQGHRVSPHAHFDVRVGLKMMRFM